MSPRPLAPVFGPNDFHFAAGRLEPGLGPEEEAMIRSARGFGNGVALEEPPAKAALRAQAAELAAKARQLSAVERELEKERALFREEQAAAKAALDEKQALLDAQLAKLGADT